MASATATAITRGRPLRVRRDNIAYALILPNLLIYVIFILIPTVTTLWLSFTNYNLFQSQFVGFRNFGRLFTDRLFLTSVRNTALFAVGRIVPSMALGLLFAQLLNTKVRGRNVYRTILFLPNIVSVVAASLAWLYILDQSRYGILNRLVIALGGRSREWLMDFGTALPSVIVVSIWMGVGFSMIVYLAGLQGIPASLYEAARIDGATDLRQFVSITIPLLAPTTFFLFVISSIQSFQVFGQVYIMTGGGPLNSTTTIVHQIFMNGFQGYKMGYASAQAVFLLLVVLAVTLVNFRFGNRGDAADA